MTCCQRPASGTTYRCEKHRIDMCEACLKCRDPELYCKFRSACIIQFKEKGNQRLQPICSKESSNNEPTDPSVPTP